MRKLFKTMLFGVLLSCLCCLSAHAMENDMLKVGITYGSDAVISANLQNYDGAGSGYAFGYFDDARAFVPLGAATEERKITIAVDAESATGVVVTATDSGSVLFTFDGADGRALGVQPQGAEKTVTWHRGYRYYGGFAFLRARGGNISVINIVNIEDYVKGCVGWEIGSDKPLEAIKAQAVCARTYAAMQTRHRAQGFDVCATDDCQVYRGLASANATTNRAVDETAGVYLYYNGGYAEAYYYSCNGGASEDAKNVWGNDVGYLKGKADPYEANVASRIANYNWTATFTKSELTAKLEAKGVSIGTVQNVYVSEYTPSGNVYALTFVGASGTKTFYREACRTTLGLRSMRFTTGADAGSYYINGGTVSVTGVRGVYTISGGGTVAQHSAGAGDTYVATSGGTAKLAPDAPAAGADTFTFTGSGWGHNVGLSQWGATAMAELGCGYRDILQFYYTGVTIR